MKKQIIALSLVVISATATARDDVSEFSIEQAMSNPKISNAIGEGINFYFGSQNHGKIEKKFGEWKTNKKTNAFGKSDKNACEWVFASAMKVLKQRAIKEGGNSVVNIRSNYRGNMTSSETTFVCGAGSVIAGVALIGDVVSIKK